MSRALESTIARVRRSIAEHALFPAGCRTLVAVSGGSDSIGMLGILTALRQRMGVELVVAHVHHRIRCESADLDEACARSAADQLGIPFVRCDLSVGLKMGGNIEARARNLRYEALLKLAQENDCIRIATGHTSDDQAETLLLRLLRGSGTRGLAGIHPIRADGVVRPVLDCSRFDIENASRALGLKWRVDESNADRRFVRNRIRLDVRPLLREINPRSDAVLAATAGRLHDEALVVELLLGPIFADTIANSDLLIAPLRAQPRALQRVILRHWLASLGVPEVRLSARLLGLVATLLEAGRGQRRVRIARDKWIVRKDDRLSRRAVEPDAGEVEVVDDEVELTIGHTVQWQGAVRWTISSSPPIPIGEANFPMDCSEAIADIEQLPGSMAIRCAKRGDRIQIHGSEGSRKLSDVFAERRIPASERWRYPVLCAAEVILWVPGVARSRSALIGPETCQFVRFSAHSVPRETIALSSRAQDSYKVE